MEGELREGDRPPRKPSEGEEIRNVETHQPIIGADYPHLSFTLLDVLEVMCRGIRILPFASPPTSYDMLV